MTPEQRAERIHYHEYKTLEGIHEHAERIVKLEELLSTSIIQTREMCELSKDRCAYCPLHFGDDECRMVVLQNDMSDMGIEVRY